MRYYTVQVGGCEMVVDPSKVGTRWALPILKVMPGQRFEVLVCGSKWWFFGSHWYEKQFLCVGDGCEGCVYGSPRVMGYRAALLKSPQRMRAVLLEAPLPSVARCETLSGMEGMECGRGAWLCLTRKHRRAGVALEPLGPEVEPAAARLTDQHTIGALGVLFGLPTIEETETPEAWASRVKDVAYARLMAAIAHAK